MVRQKRQNVCCLSWLTICDMATMDIVRRTIIWCISGLIFPFFLSFNKKKAIFSSFFLIRLRLTRLNEEIGLEEQGEGDTYNDVMKDFSRFALSAPQTLERTTITNVDDTTNNEMANDA